MRKHWIALCAVALTAVLCAALASGGKSAALARPVQAAVCAVEKGAVEQTLEACGVVRGVEEYAVPYPANGVTAQVYVRPGQHVKKGQALFRMDASMQESAVSALLQGAQEQSALQAAALQALGSGGKISLEDAIRQLEAMTVRAPADGIVRQVNAARYGGGAAGSAAVVMSGEESRVVLSLVPHDTKRLKTGMLAHLTLDGEALGTARVAEIAPAAADALTGRLLHEVTLTPDARLSLPLGTQVDVDVVLQSFRDVPTVPSGAVTAAQTVWWVSEGRAWEAPVEVFMQDERLCWVDLEEGVQVIASPQQLQNGQRIEEETP